MSKPHLCFSKFCSPFSCSSTMTLPGPITRMFMESHLLLWLNAGRSGLSGWPQSTNCQPFCAQKSASFSAMGRSGLVSTRCGPSTTKVQSMWDGAKSYGKCAECTRMPCGFNSRRSHSMPSEGGGGGGGGVVAVKIAAVVLLILVQAVAVEVVFAMLVVVVVVVEWRCC